MLAPYKYLCGFFIEVIMPKPMIDLTGQRFGRLTVIRRDESRKKAAYWLCRCDCGKEKVVQGCHLRSGATVSCGCLHMENAFKSNWSTHGGSGTRLYAEWIGMKGRCCNKRNKRYPDYGGRGIKVCSEWLDSFEAFREWALANGYQDDLTIERKDVNGDYCPENCCWATQKEQQNNRRNNHYLTYQGRRQTIKQWAEETGINEVAIYSRINKLGWPPERALTEPINNPKKPN